MYSVTQCPICEGTSFKPFLNCVDYSVSQEMFPLIECTKCQLVITSPRPDDQQLGKYYNSPQYISHSAESQSILDKIYRLARYFTLRWKLSVIKKHSKTYPTNLLDIGCGTGDFLHYCQTQGIKTNGIEPSPNARAVAERKIGRAIATTLDEITEKHSCITLWHVLEHIPDLSKTLTQTAERLTENGTIFIAVPNHLSYDAQRYKNYWAGYDVPRHLWHFKKSNMESLLNKNTLKLKGIVPMKLDSFYVSLLSEKYKHNRNTFATMAPAFYNGVLSNLKARKSHQYSSLIYIAEK